MRGIRTISKTSTNEILISIPDELKNTELEIIILPASNQEMSDIEFWSDDELKEISKLSFVKPIDNEDYSKW